MLVVKRIDFENIKSVEHLDTQALHPPKGLLRFTLKDEISGYRLTFRVTFSDGHVEIVKRNSGTYDCDVLVQYMDGTVEISEVSQEAKRQQKIDRILLIFIMGIFLAIGIAVVAYISYDNSFYTEVNGKKYVVAEKGIYIGDFNIYKEDGTVIKLESNPGRNDPYFVVFSNSDETGRGIKIGDSESDFFKAYKGVREEMTEYTFSGKKCYRINFLMTEKDTLSQAIYFFVADGKITEIYGLAESKREYLERVWDAYEYLNPKFVFYKEYEADNNTRKQICLWLPVESLDDDSIINIWESFDEFMNGFEVSHEWDYEIKIYCENKSEDEYYVVRTMWDNTKYYEIADTVNSENEIRLIEVFPHPESDKESIPRIIKLPPGYKIMQIDPEDYDNELEYAEDAAGVDWDTVEEAVEYYDDNH